jgi:peptidyl-tRNA hydrolase
VRGRTDVQPGETVHLTIAPGKLHAFDPKTGRRRELAA